MERHYYFALPNCGGKSFFWPGVPATNLPSSPQCFRSSQSKDVGPINFPRSMLLADNKITTASAPACRRFAAARPGAPARSNRRSRPRRRSGLRRQAPFRIGLRECLDGLEVSERQWRSGLERLDGDIAAYFAHDWQIEKFVF